jgi:superfamily I DNA/RNA helicase
LPPEPAERARRILATWPADDTPRAVLARTNRELAPAAVAALEANRPFRAASVRLTVESALVDELLDRLERETPSSAPLLLRLGRLRAAVDSEVARSRSHDDHATNEFEEPTAAEVTESLLGWAAGHRTLGVLRSAIQERRHALAVLRRDDAPLSLATAHGTKGLEFDDVAVIDMDANAFPSARTIGEATEPERALEEERRLAYVAWTRARCSLTLVYDPAAPSPFLAEAFEPAELGPG